MARPIAETKEQFIEYIKGMAAEGHLEWPILMTEANGEKVIDRIAMDEEFSDLIEMYQAELPDEAYEWELTYEEGGQ